MTEDNEDFVSALRSTPWRAILIPLGLALAVIVATILIVTLESK